MKNVLAALLAALASAHVAHAQTAPPAAPVLRALRTPEARAFARWLPRRPGGSVRAAWAFDDARGRHAVVLSRRPRPRDNTADLHVAVLRREGAGYRVLLALDEPGWPCDDDSRAEFADPAVALSDVDGDGVAEVRAAWLTNCVTDCSGPTVTVVVLEDGRQQVRVSGSAAAPGEGAWAFGQARYEVANVTDAERAGRLRLAMGAWASLAAAYAPCVP